MRWGEHGAATRCTGAWSCSSVPAWPASCLVRARLVTMPVWATRALTVLASATYPPPSRLVNSSPPGRGPLSPFGRSALFASAPLALASLPPSLPLSLSPSLILSVLLNSSLCVRPASGRCVFGTQNHEAGSHFAQHQHPKVKGTASREAAAVEAKHKQR